MKTVTDSTAMAALNNAKNPIVIKFEANWCMPCKAMKPTIEALSKELDGKVDFLVANVEHCQMLAQRFKINQIPALVTIDNGVQTAVKTGAASKAEILSWIKTAIPIEI